MKVIRKIIAAALITAIVFSLTVTVSAADEKQYTRNDVKTIYKHAEQYDLGQIVSSLERGESRRWPAADSTTIELAVYGPEDYENLDSLLDRLDALYEKGLIPNDNPLWVELDVTGTEAGNPAKFDKLPEENHAILWVNEHPLSPCLSKNSAREICATAAASGYLVNFDLLPDAVRSGFTPSKIGDEDYQKQLEIDKYDILLHPELRTSQRDGGSPSDPGGATPKFTDIPDGAWYAEAVNAMAGGGVLAGRGDGTFDPEANVTLAELSVIYTRLLGLDLDTLNSQAEGTHWARGAMANAGLGGSDFSFADKPAYRGDALTRLATEQNVNLNFDLNSIADRDAYHVGRRSTDSDGNVTYIWSDNGHYMSSLRIDLAYQTGLTTGMDENHTCSAFSTLTRAQLAQMCYNMGWTTTGCLK